MHSIEEHKVLLQEDVVFAELVDNVLVAIKYFNDRVEAARKEGGWDWSVEKVLEVIKGTPTPVKRSGPWTRETHHSNYMNLSTTNYY